MTEFMREDSIDTMSFLYHWLIAAHSKQVLMLMFLGQIALSALMAFICWRLLPSKFREPRWFIRGLLFSFCFFIPLIGVIFLLITVKMGLRWQEKKRAHPFYSLYLPEFDLVMREPEIKFGSGGIKACLDNTAMPPRRRLQALLTMQSVTARTSNPVLQNLLNDSGEDIRLVAYGLLDGREKKINFQIHNELKRLNSNQNPAIRLISLRHLAELQWEFVYTTLAQGDLRKRALSEALNYLDQALEIDQEQAGLWFLKGRVQLERRLYAEAQLAFNQSERLGLVVTRLYPYLAELAFVQGKFFRVRKLLSLMDVGSTPVRMESLMHYWTTKNSYLDSHSEQVK